MRSLGPEQVLGEMLLGTLGSLAELLSDGKSGSFFYFSNDGRYLIKTVPLRELTALLELLPEYTRHMRAHPHSLLPRFCGAFTLRLPGAGPSPFVALNNGFGAAEGTMHRRYDLKGSTVGRSAAASGGGGPAEEGAVLKDNDLARPLRLARASALEAIGAQDVPSLLHGVTNGAFKFYWSTHLLSRAHVAFERLDDDRKFAEMRAMLASNEDLAAFLRWHMTMTTEVWTWNFAEP